MKSIKVQQILNRDSSVAGDYKYQVLSAKNTTDVSIGKYLTKEQIDYLIQAEYDVTIVTG